jgi:hypothetical protein
MVVKSLSLRNVSFLTGFSAVLTGFFYFTFKISVIAMLITAAEAAWEIELITWATLLWLHPDSLCRLIQVENLRNTAMSHNTGTFPNLKLHT